jgi:hypothetical protein
MAKQQTTRVSSKKKSVEWHFPLGPKNFMIFGVGALVILLGYILMNTAVAPDPNAPNPNWNSTLSTTVAPVILVIGYCVIIPLGIFLRFDKSSVE